MKILKKNKEESMEAEWKIIIVLCVYIEFGIENEWAITSSCVLSLV